MRKEYSLKIDHEGEDYFALTVNGKAVDVAKPIGNIIIAFIESIDKERRGIER